MRKMIAAVSAGLLLVAGQAAATSSNSATAIVGDRVGGSRVAAGEGMPFANLPVPLIAIVAIIATGIYFATDDDPVSK